jgi:hypothetical protein
MSAFKANSDRYNSTDSEDEYRIYPRTIDKKPGFFDSSSDEQDTDDKVKSTTNQTPAEPKGGFIYMIYYEF